MNKDILYTARWHSKEIEKAKSLDEAQKIAGKLTAHLTQFIDMGKPEVEAKPKGKKVRIVIMVGHSLKAPGASLHGGGHEYGYNKKVAMAAAKHAHDVLFDECELFVIFRDGIGRTGAYEKAKELNPDAVIELHFNAFNKRVVGTELLFDDEGDRDPKLEKAYADHLLDAVYKVFRPGAQGKDRALRGVKDLKRGDRGWVNVSRVLDCPSVLIEPFFGDTPSEAQLARQKMNEYAETLVESTVEFFRS